MSLITQIGRILIPDGQDGGTGNGFAYWWQRVVSQQDPKLNNRFATVEDRDATFANHGTGRDYRPSALAPAGGLRCWIENRQAWSTWTGARWEWEPRGVVLSDQYDPGPRLISGVPASSDPSNVLGDTGFLTLPPGQRRIEVFAQATVLPFGSEGGARIWIEGTGTSQRNAQTYVESAPEGNVPKARYTENLTLRFPNIRTTGTQRWRVRGLVEGGVGTAPADPAGTMEFGNINLVVIDHGAVD